MTPQVPSDTVHFIMSLAGGCGLGAVIGLERQWHQSVAGLRTNALVGVAAAAFVALPTLVPEDGTGPAHMANYIVTGIGFLGGGTILREGAGIKGMNTAATLWATGAVGALCGCGLLPHAFLLTVAVLTVNMLMRPIATLLGHVMDRYGAGAPTSYLIEASCRKSETDRIRALLAAKVSSFGFTRHGVAVSEFGDSAAFSLDVVLIGSDTRDIDRFVSELWADPAVTMAKWSVIGSDIGLVTHVPG